MHSMLLLSCIEKRIPVQFHRRIFGLFSAIAMGTFTVSAPAQAVGPTQQEIEVRSVISCDGGSHPAFIGGQGKLANGILVIFPCYGNDRSQGKRITRVNIEYQKHSGAAAHIRFGWRYQNVADHLQDIHWDEGSFIQQPGTTRSYSWFYGNGLHVPQNAGIQGIIQDQNSGALYVTKQAGPW